MSLVADHISRHSIDTLLRGQSRSGALVAIQASQPTTTRGCGTEPFARTRSIWSARRQQRRRAWLGGLFDRIAPRTHRVGSRRRERRPRTSAGGVSAGAVHPGRLAGSRRRRRAWPNFQVDGYGIWLWAFEQHLDGPRPHRRSQGRSNSSRATSKQRGSCAASAAGGARRRRARLDAGAVAAGLAAAARLLDDARWETAAAAVRGALAGRSSTMDASVAAGRSRVDGSLSGSPCHSTSARR